MSNAIWIVSASRGDYSDRTEYPVCWCDDEQTAKALVEEMQRKSDEWRMRMSDHDDPWSLSEQATKDIGDDAWSHWDVTRYAALLLPHCRSLATGEGKEG